MKESPVEQVLEEAAALIEVRGLRAGLVAGSAQMVHGIGGSVKTLLGAVLHRTKAGPSLLVCPDLEAARRTETDLATWLGDAGAALLPAREFSPLGVVAQSGEIQAQRLWVLDQLLAGKPLVVVASIDAVTGLFPSPERLRRNTVAIAVGDVTEPHDVAALLVEAGYERVAMVDGPGDFSLRGGILDVFPPTREDPLRLEFFGDEIASIRSFSVATQKSTDDLDQARIGPAREWLLRPDEMRSLADRLRREVAGTARRLEELGRREAAERLQAKVEADVAALDAGLVPGDVDAYAALIESQPTTIFSYLGRGALVVLDEPARLEQAAGHLDRERSERLAVLLDNGGLLPAQAVPSASYGQLPRLAREQALVYLTQILRRAPTPELTGLASLRYQTIPSFQGNWGDFVTELQRWRRGGDRVLVLSSTGDGGAALARALREADVIADPSFAAHRPAGQVVVGQGTLEGGFYLPGAHLRVVTDAQIRGRQARRRRRRTTALTDGVVRNLASYRDLAVGDHVVHVNHGVGVYLGVKSLEIDGVTRDYIFIKYADEDRLYVPTDQVGLIQKYVGVDGQEPKLHRLAGSEWARTKKKTRESLQKLAIDLLKLYAVRQSQPGLAFSPDTPWQAEFEAGFRYEETPDQLAAVEDIKRDMERPVPMDRLLCGDVGYGKTEVAIRAAFKSVMDGRQVAVLVPTTVLAQQHFLTFKERFAGYPVNVDLLSRFRSRARQTKTIRELKRGTVDIVIGTHRLLAQDVVFKDLGLLIVDEEHRFGVGHKERIKELRANVDVLVLTATPIPRTLNMAMIGLRDMSVIETPPEDRYPVQTYVLEYDEELVRDAVLRELGRGGQVFYVHNRVQSIDQVVERLRHLVPQARIAVGHGQMKEDDLERVMMDFLEGEYDILVSTTIIESGLDLPNVNTLIVEDADTLGLAQLYQLRGRVGRSNRVAYAYFTYRQGRVISEVAEKRLEAIRDFTELGSGYKIALRDLEIRGAGNLLGAEQHGFIASVGFELYCRMLEEAVRELKGEPGPVRVETAIDVNVNAFIPETYIPDSRQKIEAYQRMAAVTDLEDAGDLEAELIDRYGPAPEPVANLLTVARLRGVAGGLGVTTISRDPMGGLVARFERPSEALRQVLAGLAGNYPGVRHKSSSQAVLLTYRPGRRPELGGRKTGADRESVELIEGFLDLVVDVARRLKSGVPKNGATPKKGEAKHV